MELVKLESEPVELIFFGIFDLHYAKWRMLELFCNSFDKFCDVTKLEELDIDTDSPCLALSEHYVLL